MRSPSVAELTRPVAVADDRGREVFAETRTFPMVALFGVPAASLIVLSIAVAQPALRILFAAAACGILVAGYRRRDARVIEKYTVTTRYVMIEQPGGRQAAVPTDSIRSIEVRGDRVRVESDAGVLTLGFVRHKRALLRALSSVVPAVAVTTRGDPMCRT